MPLVNCTGLLLGDIDYDCNVITAPVGVDKDLMIFPYEDFNRTATLDALNREADNTNGNEGGLTDILFSTIANAVTFTGTDYSVVPTVSQEVKDDGDSWFVHQIMFTAYSKTAKTRKVIEALGSKRVLAVVIERSTGLYEVFGIDQGLKLSAVDREYVGAQNSNFYQVTLITPDIAVIRESSVGELAINAPSAVI